MTEKFATNLLTYGTIGMAAVIILSIIAFVIVYERKRKKKWAFDATTKKWFEIPERNPEWDEQ